MDPFRLLVVFAMLAVLAFGTFTYLTLSAPSPLKEDWKKFLSSFAGTALALSVGFISLMLQQHNQADARRSDETARELQQENEEAARIKARLFYSLVQKKFDLSILREFMPGKDRIGAICQPSGSDGDSERAFQKIKDTAQHLDDHVKAALKELYASSPYERNTLNKLLRETNFSARVDQRMSSFFMENELELYVLGPIAVQGLDIFSVPDRATFCGRVSSQANDIEGTFARAQKLQLYTCVAYGLAEAPAADSVARSGILFDRIGKFASTPRDKRQKDTLISEIEADMGNYAGLQNLETCLKSADIRFDEL